MSSSLFVNKSDRIKVTVSYSVNTVTDEVTIVNVDPSDKTVYKTITAEFRKPDFEDIQNITQASTIFQNGVPMLDILRAGKAILYCLIESWDIRDEQDKAIPCDAHTINALHPAVGNALSAGIQAKMGNLSQMFA
jgi:hypothetical protein